MLIFEQPMFFNAAANIIELRGSLEGTFALPEQGYKTPLKITNPPKILTPYWFKNGVDALKGV